MMQQTDILIVGGGCVGLSLAAALIDSGQQVTVLDAGNRPADVEDKATPEVAGQALKTDYRADVLAVNHRSQRFLAQVGAWELLPANALTPYLAMAVYDGLGSGALTFRAEDEGLDQLGFIVEQPALRAALVRRLEEAGSAQLLWRQDWRQAQRDGHGYCVSLAGEDLSTRLLVGADGGASDVRDLAGIKTLGWQYPQQAVVCVAQTEQPHGNLARQWFTDKGPLAFLPLANEQLVGVIWSCTDAEDKLALADGDICEALQSGSEAMLGQVTAVTERVSFPLAQRQALSYARAGVAILGDAAHTIHPLAGQGANLGFADARTLAQELRRAAQAGRDPGEAASLRRYQRLRQTENHLAGLAMEAFYRFFSPQPALVEHWGMRLVRSAALDLVDAQPQLKHLAVKLATGLYA